MKQKSPLEAKTNGHKQFGPLPTAGTGTANGASLPNRPKPFHSFLQLLRRFAETPVVKKIRRKVGPLAARARISFDSSFCAKVLLPVTGCLAILVAVTFIIVDHRLAQQSEQQARLSLATASAVIHSSQEFRRSNLLLRFHNLPNEPLWRQIFKIGESRDLHNTLRDLMDMQKLDILYYASNRGKIMDVEANNPAIPVPDFERASALLLKVALRGDERTDTVCVGGKLYDVVAIPAFDPDNKQIGVLAVGLELGDSAAQEFGKLTQSQIALVANGRVTTATLPGVDANAQFVNAFERALPTNSRADPTANITPIVFNGVHYYCIAGRFDALKSDSHLGYVLLHSREAALAALRATQRMLAGMGLLAILLGAAAVWFFVSKVTQPLRELRQGAEAVGRGDFDLRVPVRSRDECGQLAQVFNQMTENLQQSRVQLEKTVETLKTTQAQLVQSEKLSAIGEFVAGVAHELNNPLAAVVGFSEILQKENTGEKSRHYSETIFKAALRCKKIVQSLLSFARREKPERKLVSMNSLVEAVLDIVNYSLRTSNIEVVTRLEADLPLVLADMSQIQQVLLNIINNAHQAIEASQSAGRITVTTESRTANVRVTIRDNGPGIPLENLQRIFDPFFTTKEVGKGTGLGLSLCYGFIQEHGGTITPLSQLGKGTAFVIELPVVNEAGLAADAAPLSEAEPAKPSDPLEGRGKRVLVIDDEKPILNLIREDLAFQGYKVEVADNGETALAKLKQNHFDLAFCDWKMPGLTGRQIYEQLRETNPRLCRRVIFITGDVINEQMRRFLETEKRPCLTKPFTLPELHSAVEIVLKTA